MPPRPALILLVEDDAVLRRLFSDALKTQGFRVEEASTFDEAVYLFENEPVDLAVLDVMLPDKDGFSLLRFIRKKRQSLPVIMLTALNGANDCLRGFDCGADDYISKPVDIRVFLARVKNVLRHAPAAPSKPTEGRGLPLGNGCILDTQNRELFLEPDRHIPLSLREFLFLSHLSETPEKIVSEAELLVRVWKQDAFSSDTACIRTLVSRLRRKSDGALKIRNIYGQGYRLG